MTLFSFIFSFSAKIIELFSSFKVIPILTSLNNEQCVNSSFLSIESTTNIFDPS